MLRTIFFSGFLLIYSSLSSQSADTLRLFVADQTLYAGNSYSFPIYSNNFDSIVAFQFSLSLSQEYVDSARIYSDNLLEMESNFNWRKEKNQLGLLWSSPTGLEKSVPKDTSLFSIYLRMKKEIKVRDLIKLMYNGFVPAECLNYYSFFKQSPTLGLSLNYDPNVTALILAADNVDASKNEIKLFPNPCKAGSVLHLTQAQNFNSYQILNLDGKTITSKQILTGNQLTIPANLSTGNYFIQLYDANHNTTKAKIEIVH